MSDTPYIRPDVRAFLAALAANPRPAMTAEILPHLRPLAAQGMAMNEPPPGELAVVRDFDIPSRDGVIPARLFDARAERAAGPIVLFCHGGGFVIGSIDTHVAMCAEIARRLDLPVVSIDYRLAPEHPWPAAPEDAECAARWVADAGAALGRGCTGLVLCGDSAGGNLAIVTALALRDAPAAVPVSLLLAFYPAVDPHGDYASARDFSEGYGLDRSDMTNYNAYYRPPNDARGAPLLADLGGLPPSLIVTAALDPLRDQGRAFAAKAITAGVRTTYIEAAGTIHGFAGFRRAIPSGQADFVNALAIARQMLDEPAG